MARLIGYMANRADRLRDAFHQERLAIAGLPVDQRGAWGIGFYQGDEVLHKKQPAPDGEPIDWDVIANKIKTDCAIAHLRQATVGGFSIDNTHPFRLRQWLFAHVGTVRAFEEIKERLLGGLPDFLRRNIRGSSDSELFFHMVLAGLHTRNQLEAAEPNTSAVLESIADAVRTIDELAQGAGAPSTLNMILCNGRGMYALRRGGPFGYTEHVGLQDPAEPGEEKPRPGSPVLHYVMLVSGGHEIPQGYAALDDSVVAVVHRDLKLKTHAL
ncbi:MAG TPA: class II glutamine amidotransferase [Polyangiaceae bacterium]|nr:class II glutamine amidotransferase [Polyangiaceae bacterium]